MLFAYMASDHHRQLKKNYKSYIQRQYKASLEVQRNKVAKTLEMIAQVYSSKGKHEWQPEIKEGVEGSDRGTERATRKDQWNWKTIWRQGGWKL